MSYIGVSGERSLNDYGEKTYGAGLEAGINMGNSNKSGWSGSIGKSHNLLWNSPEADSKEKHQQRIGQGQQNTYKEFNSLVDYLNNSGEFQRTKSGWTRKK